MSIDVAVRARLEAELGRIFGEMIAAQERANALEAENADLRQQLAQAQDQIQKGVDS